VPQLAFESRTIVPPRCDPPLPLCDDALLPDEPPPHPPATSASATAQAVIAVDRHTANRSCTLLSCSNSCSRTAILGKP